METNPDYLSGHLDFDTGKEPKDTVGIGTYNVFHPLHMGLIIGRLDKNLKEKPINRELNGAALPQGVLETIVSQMERGVAAEKAKLLLDSALVAPALGNPKEDECFTLSEFIKKCVNNEQIKYKHITSGNRYTSKVDWTSNRARNQVQDLLSKGKSLAQIARYLGVSRSTLSKANKRNGYRLYIPERRVN